MKLIACIDRNWGIGKDNALLFDVKEDKRFFQRMTTGHIVLMGRRTMESLPNQKPLKGRRNVVLTSKPFDIPKGFEAVQSVSDAIERYDTEDMFIIGGGKVYESMVHLCDTAYITRVDETAQADVFMPNLDEINDWRKAVILNGISKHPNAPAWHIIEYKRVKK